MATKKKGAANVLPAVVEPEVLSPDEQLARLDGDLVTRWLGGVRQFFKQATELELGAKAHLVRMEGIQVPTNSYQDAQVMDLVRIATSGKKEIEAHWTIAGVLDKLHKRAVQGRKRGTDAYDQAATIGNRLHAAYNENERRRVDEENRRRQREAEEQAAKERRQELDDLEAAALKAEASSPDLSERERMFVDLMAVSGADAVLTARRCGFKDPSMGARLLARPKIQVALAAAVAAAAARRQAAAIKSTPVVADYEEARPERNVGDRTTTTCVIEDEKAFRDAAFDGGFDIPRDCFNAHQAAVNAYGRMMPDAVAKWPGIRVVKTTRVV